MNSIVCIVSFVQIRLYEIRTPGQDTSAATHPGTYGSNGKEAQELGLEYGPVNYFMMCDPKYANDLGEVVQ